MGPSFDMNGDLSFIQNRPIFIVGDPLADPDEISVDSLLIKDRINPQKPTLTKRIDNPSADNVEIRLPSSIDFSSLWYGNNLDVGAFLKIYFTDISYRYLQYTRGLDPTIELQIMLNVVSPYFLEPENLIVRMLGFEKRLKGKWQLKLGSIFFKEIKEGYDDDDEFNPGGTSIPLFTLSRSMRLNKHLQLNMTLIGLPATFIKSTFTYRL